MRRLLVEHVAGEMVRLAGEQHHRITRVLRLGRGDALRIADGRGREWEAVIESCDRAQVVLRLARPVDVMSEPRVKVVLFQSLPRGDAMERVIQKCIEIGVAEIVPIITGRTVARPRAGAPSARLARWRKIALHAVEQSGRAWLVPVAEPAGMEAMVEQLRRIDAVLVPHHGAAEPIGAALTACQRPDSAGLVIGPEGGFAPDEIERFASAGARIVSLGPRVLRSETAGLVAAAIVFYHFGEMG